VKTKYEAKPNTATLFLNEDKRPDQVMKNPDGSEWVRTDADYRGSGLIGGVNYWVDLYKKKSKTGNEYFSIKVKPKGAPTVVKKAVNSGLTEDNWDSVDFNDDEIKF